MLTHFWCVGMALFKSVMSFDLFSETKAEQLCFESSVFERKNLQLDGAEQLRILTSGKGKHCNKNFSREKWGVYSP